jgi:hypothetical protein
MAKKVLAFPVALIAVAAMALPAAASASPEFGETSGGSSTRLTTGVAIRGTNVGVAKMTDANGNNLYECMTAQMDGTLNTNTGNLIEITIESSSFSGTGNEGSCTGFFGSNMSWTTNLGNGVPWCLVAGGKLAADTFSLRGNSCANAGRSITTAIDTSFGQCKYERASAISGTFTTDVSGQEANLSITKQEIPAEAGNPFGCPSNWYFDITYRIETANGTPLYVK